VCLSCLFYKMKNEWLFSIKMSFSSLQSYLTQDTYSINKWWKCYNILSKDAMIQMDIYPSKLTTIKKTFLIRIEQRGVSVEGALNLPVTIGTYFKFYILQRISWSLRWMSHPHASTMSRRLFPERGNDVGVFVLWKKSHHLVLW